MILLKKELIKENNGMQPSMDDIIEHVKLEASKVIDNIDDYRIILEKEENNEDPDVIDPEMEKKIIKLQSNPSTSKRMWRLWLGILCCLCFRNCTFKIRALSQSCLCL